MDLQFADHTIHLPQEVVNYIASHFQAATDIAATRLVNRSLYNAATALMLDIKKSPSELFPRPTAAEIQEIEELTRTDPSYFRSFDRWTKSPLTIWTWLRVPRDVALEDRQTDLGRAFLASVTAPSKHDNRPALKDPTELTEEEREVVDDILKGKGGVPMHSGRKGTCWGRMQEEPDLFCVVMRECEF